MPDPMEPVRRPDATAASVSLERALERARWAILWERLWPPLAALLTVIGLFLAVSWLGLWLWLPPMGRGLGLFVFFALLAPTMVRALLFVRFPSRHDGLRRLVARVRNLRAGLPLPRLSVRDPFALRALVLILAVATFFAAGGERGRRIAAAFDWQGVVVPPNFRLDAWVLPPAYTAKAPVILPGVRPGEQTQAQASAVSVPAGSVLIIRASGKAQFDVVVAGGLEEAAGDQRPQAPAGTEEHRYTITDRGTATLRGLANDDIVWAFNAIPDRPPTIALAKDPEPQARGSLSLSYKVEDDYGVSEACCRRRAPRAASARPSRI